MATPRPVHLVAAALAGALAASVPLGLAWSSTADDLDTTRDQLRQVEDQADTEATRADEATARLDVCAGHAQAVEDGLPRARTASEACALP